MNLNSGKTLIYLSLLFFVTNCYSYSDKNKEYPMDLAIILNITNKAIKKISDNTFVYAVGEVINLEARFINKGKISLQLNDPVNYAETSLAYMEKNDLEASIIFLNPANIDSTGEITAQNADKIELKPDASLTMNIELFRYVPEQLYAQEFEIKVMYDEIESNDVKISMKFLPESVELLLNVLLDNNYDSYTQKQALTYLSKLPCDLDYTLAGKGESQIETDNRTSENKKNIEEFTRCWVSVKDSAEVRKLFGL